MDRGPEATRPGAVSTSPPDAPTSRGSMTALMVIALGAVAVCAFTFDIQPLAPKLDPDYIYTFNDAATRHVDWGTSLVMTYGPYGFALETMDVGNLVARRLVLSILHALALAIAAVAYVRSVPDLSPVKRIVTLVVVVYAVGLQGVEYQWFTLFLLVLVSGALGSGWTHRLAFPAAGLLAGFFMLMKFSLGFAALLALMVGCLLTMRPASVVYRIVSGVGAMAIGFCVFWIAAGGAVSNIPAYLRSGLEMSRGYSSAMGTEHPRGLTDVALIAAWLVLLALWIVWQRRLRPSLVLVAFALPLFVAWKHSVVRHDVHVVIIAKFAFFVLAILLAETLPDRHVVHAVWPFAVLLLPPALLWGLTVSRNPTHVWEQPPAESLLGIRGAHELMRAITLPAYRRRVAEETQQALASNQLSASVTRTIGSASTDVYPWDASLIRANGLRWAHRPVPASFSAYTAALDEMNTRFLQSPGRPRYLLWHGSYQASTHVTDVSSIDGRHLFWDEPRTLRAIVGTYEMVDATEQLILMRASEQHRFGPVRRLTTTTAAWNTWVPVPTADGVVFAAPSIRRSRILDAVTTLYRADPMLITVRLESGKEHEFRAVPETMAGGLWMNPLPISLGDVRRFLEDGTGPRVVAVKFWTRRLTRTFAPQITVDWYAAAVRPWVANRR
jgi:hypothetical protein